MSYHLQISLLDRSQPNAARALLRGTPSQRSAGRTPHQTPTGLPGPLDLDIANAPAYSPSAGGFWQDLSRAPTTRSGERWDALAERQLAEPKIEWYEPDSIKRPGFTPAPTLDYRFGPISADWVDNPGGHPAFGVPAAAAPAKDARAMEAGPSYSSHHASSSGAEPPQARSSRQTAANAKGGAVPALSPPTALFVPSDDPAAAAKYQLGTTDFGYGTVHLYRDAREAEGDAEVQRRRQAGKGAGASDRAGSSATSWRGSGNARGYDGTVVGVLAIPSYMTPSDFLAFIAPAVELIESVRILRDAMPNRSIGLVRFRQVEDAEWFVVEFNGRPFSHLQNREICHAARIASIAVKSSLIPPFTFPSLLPPDHITASANELPTCPVCLERMDASVTGLMTIPCSHTFHCNCLSKWGDSRCPVCRYSQSRLHALPNSRSPAPDGATPSECAACGSDANLWICLICGHVGCGRYQGGHAHRHFEESSHTYALELGSQRVWDYVGDGYVHRLIQTRSDEIVELPALSSAVFDAGGGPGRDAVAQQSKIEAISEEFGSLVASQLDSQRAFYEKELRLLEEDLEAARVWCEEGGASGAALAQERKRREELEAELARRAAERRVADEAAERLGKIEAEVVPALERDRARWEKKADKALELARKFEKELSAERAMSQGMRAKLTQLEQGNQAGEQRVEALQAQVADLSDQLRDMMFFLDAQAKIQNEGGAELQGGSVSVPAPPQPKPGRRKKK